MKTFVFRRVDVPGLRPERPDWSVSRVVRATASSMDQAIRKLTQAEPAPFARKWAFQLIEVKEAAAA